MIERISRGGRGGFTLIELSIVLVIIGLIVGGVLTGRNLIRASELRSIITDEQKYVTAVNTFRTKYNGIPGDMVDATNYWGTDPSGCPNLCSGSSCYTGPQTRTCNGNGNNLIENENTITDGSAPTFENFRAWQQLADAGLIPGAYSGTQGPIDSFDNEPGLNVPTTRMSNGGFEWNVFAPAGRQGPANWNAQYYTQYLLLGVDTTGGNDLLGAFLTPSDAQAIDLKMDDGLPASGSVLANSMGSTCTTSWSYTAPYNTSSGTPACTLLFLVKSW